MFTFMYNFDKKGTKKMISKKIFFFKTGSYMNVLE